MTYKMVSFIFCMLLSVAVISCNAHEAVQYQNILNEATKIVVAKSQHQQVERHNNDNLKAPADLLLWANKLVNSLSSFDVSSLNITNGTECADAIEEWMKLLVKADFRAISMLDATAKLPPGVFQGLMNWMGSYDECIDLNFNTTAIDFTGRYCSIKIGDISAKPLPGGIPLSVQLGMCIPSTCNIDDMRSLINSVLRLINAPPLVYATTGGCQPLENEKVPLNAAAVVVIVIFSLIGLFVVIGTLYDMLIYQRSLITKSEMKPVEISGSNDTAAIVDLPANVNVIDYTPLLNSDMDAHQADTPTATMFRNIVLSFSLHRNIGKLFHVSAPSDNNLMVIHGIRFFSMTWVILGHTIAFIIYFVGNPIIIQKFLQWWTLQAIINATVSVDSFFLLSGTLVAYLLLRQFDENGNSVNLGTGWIKFYVHRYWRLTPSYVLIIGVWTTLFQYMGEGPNWPLDNSEAGYCNTTWWTNALYVNNLVEKDKMCMGWSWYLANDMQFYIISPLFLVPLYLKWQIGVALILTTMVASMTATGVISTIDKAPLGMIGNILAPGVDPDWFGRVYIVPWTRIGPYLVGLLLGYTLWRTRLRCKMHWAVVVCGWLLATGCALALIYGPYNLIKGHIPSVALAAFFNSVQRTVWGCCVAWVIFACINGYGGFVNKLLTAAAVVPLSRLTYMAYLVHPAVIFSFYLARRQLMIIDLYLLIYMFLAHVVASYLVAFVFSMALEAPMLGIEKAILKRK